MKQSEPNEQKYEHGKIMYRRDGLSRQRLYFIISIHREYPQDNVLIT